MTRAIAGVVVGSIVLALGAIVSMTVVFSLFSLFGADGFFEPGSYDVSMTWLIASLVLGLAAALLSGVVCAVIGRRGRAPHALASIVLVAGLLLAVPAVVAQRSSDPGPRLLALDHLTAIERARHPAWSPFAIAVVAAIGVLIGAAAVPRRETADH